MNQPIGMLLLNKPAGISSFKALSDIKRQLNTGKVGHAGTLDPFAEGLLIVLVGKMTRFMQVIMDMSKTYQAGILFGEETDTLDPEGRTLYTAEIPQLEVIQHCSLNFTGKTLQKPPEYSAIKIKGKRAYQLARNGEKVEIPKREVIIYKMILLNENLPLTEWEIECSKGTYIRSIARDLGIACQSRASLQSLKRTRIGPFWLDQAVNAIGSDFRQALIPPYSIFQQLENTSELTVKDSEIKKIGQGIQLERIFNEIQRTDKSFVGLFDDRKNLIAVVKNHQGKLRYLFVV